MIPWMKSISTVIRKRRGNADHELTPAAGFVTIDGRSSKSNLPGGHFMSQLITATFEDGVLKPDEQLALPPGSRVRLFVEALDTSPDAKDLAWQELEQLWDEASRICDG